MLTLLAFVYGQKVSAGIVTQEKAKTHLRWNLFVPKDQVLIQKKGKVIQLKSLNSELLSQVSKDLEAISVDSKYIKNISNIKIDSESNVNKIDVTVSDANVELFSFYRDREKRYVMDFWIDEDSLPTKTSAISKPVSKKVDTKKKVAPKFLKRPKAKKVAPSKIVKKKKTKKQYRDFRYGASFIWNYKPVSPQRQKSINLATKTPEYFYELKDVDFEKGEKEAHVQLAINLYRKKKWGLMYKAIKLFHEKYGEDEAIEKVEYLKANALIRENLEKGNTEPVKTAVAIYSTLAERTKNYDLKRALYKYLINYHFAANDYISGLKKAKILYVESKENFDYEESKVQAENILFSLTRLNQVNKLQEVLKEKTISKLLPRQIQQAYAIYAYMRQGEVKNALKIYEKNKSALASPVEASILYNIAEAYFRQSKFQKAIKVYDQFLSEHSYHKESPAARLRIALCFDLLERPIKQTLELYKNAINRSSSGDYSLEARIRYVALSSIRNKKPTSKNIEERVFLEKRESEKLNDDTKRLLWLTRLRSLIVDGKFKKALSYLSAIPLNTMNAAYKRVYEADGAEIVYGILNQFYNEADYSNVIKLWEVYKNKYVYKVANDPYLNYIVGSSYVKLGLFDSFDEVVARFENLKETPKKTFPIWVDRKIKINTKSVLEEMKLMKNIKLGNNSLALSNIQKLERIQKDNSKIDYWKGYVHFNKKDYKNAISHFERFLTSKSTRDDLNVMETAELLRTYTDAIYQSGKTEKFLKVSDAILSDTKDFGEDSEYMKKVKERIRYLQIETISGKGTDIGYLRVEPLIKRFLDDYPETLYQQRLKYILGVSLLKNRKEKEGKKMFEAMLIDETVSNHIKEMIRSELSMLRIKDKKI